MASRSGDLGKRMSLKLASHHETARRRGLNIPHVHNSNLIGINNSTQFWVTSARPIRKLQAGEGGLRHAPILMATKSGLRD